MSELENYLEANYSVKDVLNKAKKKRKRSNDFGELETHISEPKLNDNKDLSQNESVNDDWINVETKKVVSGTSVVREDESVVSVNKKNDGGEQSSSEKDIEKPDSGVGSLKSVEEVMDTAEKPVLSMIVPSRPRKMINVNAKKSKIAKVNQIPIYRDKYGHKLHNYQPLTPKQQRRQNEAEREQRIFELNKDEFTEQLNKLKTKMEASSRVEDAQQLSKTIREDDPALMFHKSVKEKFKKAESKRTFTSICNRKLLKDESLYPLNRFGLVPGALWDGIDRGNGYEKKWLQKQVEKTHEDANKKVVTNEDNSF